MNKTEFLDALRHALGKLPSYEVEQSIAFYAEMIDDRIEDGMSEQEAVAALGSVHAIAAQIVAETPPIPKAIAKANTGSRTLNIVLLAILSPIWVTLALAFACMVLAIYLAIWSVVVALWAVVLTLASGLGLFAWFGVLAASKGLVNLTHSFARWVKGLFIKLKRNDASPIAPEGAAHV